jgi:hypothetical protein
MTVSDLQSDVGNSLERTGFQSVYCSLGCDTAIGIESKAAKKKVHKDDSKLIDDG